MAGMTGKKKGIDINQPLGRTQAPVLDATDNKTLSGICKSGSMDRRQALKWLAALGVTAAASDLLLTGVIPGAGRALAATPKKGGRLRVAMHSASAKDTLDPAKFSFSSDMVRGHSFYNGLTYLDGKAQAVPELAESFEPNKEATRWVFKLRQGVTFHDGKTLDAEDVVYSVMRHKDPKTGSVAKFHLKKAGLPGNKLELHVSPAANKSVEMGLLLQREAARIGLTIDLKREPADGYWSSIWRKRSFHGGEWNARPTYDLLLTLGWKSEAKWNETKFKSARMDALIDQGRATVDFAKRKEIYGEIQKILYEEGGNVVPAFANYIDGVSSKVKGLTPVPVGNLRGFNYADSVWLD